MSNNASEKWILVTGGCGYIGSHTVVCLLEAEACYSVVVVDNLSNSSKASLDRVCEIVGMDEETRAKRLVLHEVDLLDEKKLEEVFKSSPKFDACIHFAGLKAVGESSKMPVQYYHNNITGTLILLSLLDKYDCRDFVSSSSATVYGAHNTMPLTEASPVTSASITNPYGRTKFMMEEILKDLQASNPAWNIALLRYFNPIGAHPSGLIGEDPKGIPNNLMPYILQVAVGRREQLTIFGDDYETPDGTGVRDYLHVIDLAEGHIGVMQHMSKKQGGLFTYNLGTGKGYSVLEMVRAMDKACGHPIKYVIGPRRAGDLPYIYADPKLAKEEIGWTATRSLDEMCRDSWAWQTKNPNGYSG